MAISLTASEELSENGNASTQTIAITTSGSDRVITLGVAIPFDRTVSSVTFNGSATGWSLVSNTSQTIGAVHIERWICVGPAAASANVVVTYDASTPYRVSVVRAYSGVDQSTTVTDSDSAQGNSTTAATPTLTVANASSMVDDFMVLEDPENPTANGAQTVDEEGLWEDDIYHYAASHKTSSSDTTMSWTFGNDNWAIAGMVLKPAAAGGSFDETVTFGAVSAASTLITSLTVGQTIVASAHAGYAVVDTKGAEVAEATSADANADLAAGIEIEFDIQDVVARATVSVNGFAFVADTTTFASIAAVAAIVMLQKSQALPDFAARSAVTSISSVSSASLQHAVAARAEMTANVRVNNEGLAGADSASNTRSATISRITTIV